MRKKILLGLLVLVSAGVIWAFYLYNKPRTSITTAKAEVTISAINLFTAYQQNEAEADKKYLNKVIEVQGEIAEVQHTDSTFNLSLKGSELGGINCNIIIDKTVNIKTPEKGSVVTIKGRCAGFLMDVNLSDCIIVK